MRMGSAGLIGPGLFLCGRIITNIEDILEIQMKK